jgi:hypothetical protein
MGLSLLSARGSVLLALSQVGHDDDICVQERVAPVPATHPTQAGYTDYVLEKLARFCPLILAFLFSISEV